jgi:adenosylcobinamide-phosphate synthase
VTSRAFHLPTSLIALAALFDLWLGDPLWLPHPVRMIGWAIARGERGLRTGRPNADLAAGAILAAGVILLATVGAWMPIALGERLGAIPGALIAIIVASTTLALRGLDDAAQEVERCLAGEDEAAARLAMPALVGRDPGSLDRAGMIRGTIESVAENCSDGFVAPLLFLFAGGPVAAMAYKAINTLDSMIGHRDERYLYFGRCAARLDDAANLIPARLTALCLVIAAALQSGRGRAALATCRRDARRHPSPNAGYPEAAIAGALGIQLGGGAFYDGKFEAHPAFGEAEHEVSVRDITAARSLMRLAALLAFVVLALARFAISGLCGARA